MAEFELGEYYRVPLDIWNQYFQDVINQGDFFQHEGYYYIHVDKYDDEYDEILEKDLLDYMDYYVYLSSSIHFGD